MASREHDPERWSPVFGEDRAPAKSWSVFPELDFGERAPVGDRAHRPSGVRALPGEVLPLVGSVALNGLVAAGRLWLHFGVLGIKETGRRPPAPRSARARTAGAPRLPRFTDTD